MGVDRTESAKKKSGARFGQIRKDVVDSFAWRVIGYPARALYSELRVRYNGGNNGNISASLKTMEPHGWTASATLSTALFELQAVGLISCTRHGGVEVGSKVCSLYAFTDLDTNQNNTLGIAPARPTFAYKELDSIEKAVAQRDEGVEKLRLEAKSRKRGNGAKKKNDASLSEAVNPISASLSEAVSNSSASLSEAVKSTRKPPKALRQKGIEA